MTRNEVHLLLGYAIPLVCFALYLIYLAARRRSVLAALQAAPEQRES